MVGSKIVAVEARDWFAVGGRKMGGFTVKGIRNRVKTGCMMVECEEAGYPKRLRVCFRCGCGCGSSRVQNGVTNEGPTLVPCGGEEGLLWAAFFTGRLRAFYPTTSYPASFLIRDGWVGPQFRNDVMISYEAISILFIWRTLLQATVIV